MTHVYVYVYVLTVKLRRTQILLDPQQELELKEIARREGRSMSSLVRDLLARQIAASREQSAANQQRHKSVIERIRRHRSEAEKAGEGIAVDIAAVIRQDREDRGDEILGAGRPAGR